MCQARQLINDEEYLFILRDLFNLSNVLDDMEFTGERRRTCASTRKTSGPNPQTSVDACVHAGVQGWSCWLWWRWGWVDPEYVCCASRAVAPRTGYQTSQHRSALDIKGAVSGGCRGRACDGPAADAAAIAGGGRCPVCSCEVPHRAVIGT